MLVKGMLLKKIKILKLTIILITIFNAKSLLAEDLKIKNIIQYIKSMENFSASFIQEGGQSIEEGKIFIRQKRIRVEYNSPSKILIILDKNKAMYYNYDLDEDEFFDPQNTSAWFFFEIFKNPDFFLNSKIISENKNINIYNSGKYDNQTFKLLVFFEESPLILRKIELTLGYEKVMISIFDHKYEEEFNKDFFKLINPKIFN